MGCDQVTIIQIDPKRVLPLASNLHIVFGLSHLSCSIKIKRLKINKGVRLKHEKERQNMSGLFCKYYFSNCKRYRTLSEGCICLNHSRVNSIRKSDQKYPLVCLFQVLASITPTEQLYRPIKAISIFTWFHESRSTSAAFINSLFI